MAQILSTLTKRGALDGGKRADLILVHVDRPHQTPLYNIDSQLAYATKASDVETVIINGQIVMENRRVHSENGMGSHLKRSDPKLTEVKKAQ